MKKIVVTVVLLVFFAFPGNLFAQEVTEIKADSSFNIPNWIVKAQPLPRSENTYEEKGAIGVPEWFVDMIGKIFGGHQIKKGESFWYAAAVISEGFGFEIVESAAELNLRSVTTAEVWGLGFEYYEGKKVFVEVFPGDLICYIRGMGFIYVSKDTWDTVKASAGWN